MANGANQLNSGVQTLHNATDELYNGAQKLSDSSAQLEEHVKAGNEATKNQLAQLLVEAQNPLVTKELVLEKLQGLAGGLSENSKILETNLSALSQGAGALSSGSLKIKAGVDAVSKGISSVHNGSSQLSAGANKLAEGLNKVSNGSEKLNNGINSAALGSAKIVDGSSQLNSGVQKLSENTPKLVDGAKKLHEGLKNAQNSSKINNIKQKSKMMSAPVALKEHDYSHVENYGTGFAPYFISIGLWVGALMATFVLRVMDRRAILNGMNPLKSALISFTPFVLMGVVSQLSAGANKLAEGLNKVSNGSEKLNNGINSAALGSAKIVDGSSQLNSGVQKLSENTPKLVDGAKKLHEGLKNAQNSSKINNIKQKSKMMSAPVALKEHDYSHVENYGTGFAPYFISIGLWVGALMATFVLRVMDRRAILNGMNPLKSALISFTPFVLMGVVQAIILMGVVHGALKLQIDNVAAFYALGIIASIVFMAIMQMIMAVFKIPGRIVAIVLLMLQITSSAGTFPVQMTPSFFRVVHPYLPMTYSILGLRQAMAGKNSGAITSSIGILVLFGVIAIAITSIVARMKRTVTMFDLHPVITLEA
ncbi:YhgE/Pip C-terminal domain [Chlamydia trachomatis]|nr:YhgE/Pip C-terminal domain [Chlamydia trachomatis]